MGNQTTKPKTKSEDQQRLLRHEYFVRGYQRKLRTAVEGKQTFQEMEEAKARAMRELADKTEDQKRLIMAVQDSNQVINKLIRLMAIQGEQEHIIDAAHEKLAKKLKRTPTISEILLEIGKRPIDFEKFAVGDQRMLLRQALQLGENAREPFILCHTGYVNQYISRHVHQFDGESVEDAKTILRQAARVGLSKGMDKYDFTVQAKPLTYCKNWMRAEISAVTETEGRAIRLKSKAHDLGKNVQAAAKNLREKNKPVSVEAIAQILNEPVEKVREVFDYVTQHVVRLDAPVSQSGEGETTVGAITAASQADKATPIADKAIKEAVKAAVASIDSPYHKRVVELCYGLTDSDHAEQKDLFDGVYRAKDGKAYSAESSVIKERAKRGERVEKRSQKELNQMFSTGAVAFEPGTPEAHELARLQSSETYKADSFDPNAPFDSQITKLTGVPPTSGTIQEAKKRGERMMFNHPALSGLRPRYRGDNEIENSHQARMEIRNALVHLGVVSASQASKLKAGKETQKGLGEKGLLRMLGEKYGLIEADTGRLNLSLLAKITEESQESEENFASLMSEV